MSDQETEAPPKTLSLSELETSRDSASSSDIDGVKKFIEKQTALDPKDRIAYHLAIGAGAFLCAFIGIVFILWIGFSDRTGTSVDVYLKWVSAVAKDILLPILTLLLGYLFGVKGKD
jgi:hypothetical protein